MLGKNMKILIVDDEKDICKFVKILFRKKGFLVYSALNGRRAINKIREVKPDIALLDVHLKSTIDGIEVLKQARQLTPQCRCIMVTWDGSDEKVKIAKKLGAVAYVTKPLTIHELYKVVGRAAKYISRKRGS